MMIGVMRMGMGMRMRMQWQSLAMLRQNQGGDDEDNGDIWDDVHYVVYKGDDHDEDDEEVDGDVGDLQDHFLSYLKDFLN